MPAPQSASSHTALDPITHFTLIPLTLACFLFAIAFFVRDPHLRWEHGWMIAASIALVLLTVKSRAYSLRVQDRVIALEENLRLARVGSKVQGLTQRQLIALRFAPDAELPALAERATRENLDGKSIKAAIVTWRPDNERI